MSLKVKEINLVNVGFWNNASSTWEGLRYDCGSGTPVLTKLRAFKDASGVDLSSKQLVVDWGNFSDGGEASCTIFGAGLIASTTKSVRLRYKVQVVSDDPDVGDVVSVSEDYAYMMVKMDFGDNSVEDDIPSVVDGGKLEAVLSVKFPSFTNAMVGTDLAETLVEFHEEANWSASWKHPDNTSEYITIDSIKTGAAGSSTVPAHSGFGSTVDLTMVLPVLKDGTHTLKIFFKYYTGKNYEVPTVISTIAKVTINQDTVVATAFSPDSTATIDINFS